jgi:hypothetical protein
MYGLSKDLDLSFFVGKTLHSITFASNIIHFDFGDGVTVALESYYQHQQKQDVDHHRIGTAQAASGCQTSSLMRLLEHLVVSAQAVDEHTLTLTFDNEDSLSFIETPGPYECYEFTDGKNAWIV